MALPVVQTEEKKVDRDKIEQDITKVSNEELETRIARVSKIVYSPNQNLARQAYPVLLQLEEERNKRQAKQFEQHLANSGVKFNEIINIG